MWFAPHPTLTQQENWSEDFTWLDAIQSAESSREQNTFMTVKNTLGSMHSYKHRVKCDMYFFELELLTKPFQHMFTKPDFNWITVLFPNIHFKLKHISYCRIGAYPWFITTFDGLHWHILFEGWSALEENHGFVNWLNLWWCTDTETHGWVCQSRVATCTVSQTHLVWVLCCYHSHGGLARSSWSASLSLFWNCWNFDQRISRPVEFNVR